jgi:hypothetical protein
MTRREERLEKSRKRAEEHQRRRKTRLRLLIAAGALYIVVPLLWYGAIEFGVIEPIRTPEFKSAVNVAALIVLLVILNLIPEFYLGQRWTDRKKKQASPSSSSEVTT